MFDVNNMWPMCIWVEGVYSAEVHRYPLNELNIVEMSNKYRVH